MEIFAKQEEPKAPMKETIEYELSTTETVKDINDKDVTIPRSLGKYLIQRLNQDKESYQNQIDNFTERIKDCDDKIEAINKLKE